MTVGQKQEEFAILLARLIVRAYELGYRVRLGEIYRPPETAALYVRQGRSKPGLKRSLHCDKLAADLLLFKGGEYLESTADHEELGRIWEGMDVMCRWGGRFGDGNHYSYEHEGRK